MATPMRSTDFRSIVEPILNEEFNGIYEQRADEYAQVFKTFQGIARNYHEEPVLYGFGAAPELPDGMPVTYQSGGVLFIQRYVYKVYGLAFALTKVLVEDGDHIRIGQTYARHLAQSLIETKETLGANILNRAFNGSYVGGDGVSLVATNHPLANGATFSNQLNVAAALSQTSLEQMLIQIRNAVDNNGKRIRLTPKKIVAGPSNVFQAEVLLKSVLRAGTADNDINPVKSMGLLGDGQANLGDLLQEAYENGQLKGRQIIEAKRLIEKRMEHGPASPNRDQIKPPTSSYSLVRTYQREVERQRKMVLKAEHAHQRLLLVVQGLKKLFADEHFVNLLRAEGLDTLPKYLAERINTLGSGSTPDHPEPEGATL